MDEDCHQIPHSFAETVLLVENYVLEQIELETKRQRLYYHTVDHALAVKRRAKTIFKALDSNSLQNQEQVDLNRLENLLDICAISHDMVQEFMPSRSETARKRCFGVSEAATIEKLIGYLQHLNRKLLARNLNSDLMFTDLDLQIIQESISATVCHYDLAKNSIYQPYLYETNQPLSIAAKIIALADLGSLGMDGIDAYLQESILIFVEDNPDLAHLILGNESLTTKQLNLTINRSQFRQEDLQFKLVGVIDSIVNFAKERYRRFDREISSFSPRDREILRYRVFPYLTPETLQKIELLMPKTENFSPLELINCLAVTNSPR